MQNKKISSSVPFTGKLKGYFRRRKYQRLDGTDDHDHIEYQTSRRKKVKITRFRAAGSNKNRRFWKIRAIPKLRFKINIFSPMKILARLRDAYVNMMLSFTGNVNGDNFFGNKRIPKARAQVYHHSGSSSSSRSVSKAEEFEMKLIVEIYKSLLASRNKL